MVSHSQYVTLMITMIQMAWLIFVCLLSFFVHSANSQLLCVTTDQPIFTISISLRIFREVYIYQNLNLEWPIFHKLVICSPSVHPRYIALSKFRANLQCSCYPHSCIANLGWFILMSWLKYSLKPLVRLGKHSFYSSKVVKTPS